MRFIRWLAVPAMLAIGAGAVYVGTFGLQGGATAASSLLTSGAQLTTVSQEIAATGSVGAALSYGLAFGVDAVIVGDAASSSGTATTWPVRSVAVAVGAQVRQGQGLARADTSDLETQLASTKADLAAATISLTQATDALADAEPALRVQLSRALDDIDVAELNLQNARATLADTTGAAPRRQARISVIQAEAQLATARASAKDLRAAIAGDDPDETRAVMNAQATVDDLEAQITELQQQIARAQLTAPVDGLVTEVNITAGYDAPTGDAIVIAGQTLQVVADVVESDLAAVSVGQPATVTIDAVDQEVVGTVTAVAPAVAGASGSVVTYPVTVTLTDPDATIRAGMSADVSISVAQAANVVAVPIAALNGRGGSYSVQVQLADGTTESRAVTVGLVTDTLAEIQSGLSAGDQVVIGTSTAQTQATTQAGTTGTFPGTGTLGGSNFGGPGGQRP